MDIGIPGISYGNRVIKRPAKSKEVKPVKQEKYSDKYVDKNYNIVSRANEQGIQTVSSFKVVEAGSEQYVNTPKGIEKQTVEYGEVLFTNPKGEKSLVPVGNIAKEYFVDDDARKALLAIAQDALESDSLEYEDYEAYNEFYIVNGNKYLPPRNIAEKVSGLQDPSKYYYESGGYRVTNTYTSLC